MQFSLFFDTTAADAEAFVTGTPGFFALFGVESRLKNVNNDFCFIPALLFLQLMRVQTRQVRMQTRVSSARAARQFQERAKTKSAPRRQKLKWYRWVYGIIVTTEWKFVVCSAQKGSLI